MSNEALITELKSLIVETLNLEDVEPAEIETDQQLFGGGLELDSLDALQLAVAVEEHYTIRIDGETEGKQAFASVRALAAHIEAARSSA